MSVHSGITKDREEQTCRPTDVRVVTDKTISVRQFDKLCKYKDQEIKMENMRDLKARTVSMILVTLGMVQRRCQSHLDNIAAVTCLREITNNVLTRDI